MDLVYGRRGDAVSGAGACVARVRQGASPELYVAILYKFPSLSANAVTTLIAFANEFLSAQPKSEDAKMQNEAQGAATRIAG